MSTRTFDDGTEDRPGLLDVDAACRIFGGSKPISRATLYRGVKTGAYPKPIRIGSNSSRWIAEECARAIRERIAVRDARSSADEATAG